MVLLSDDEVALLKAILIAVRGLRVEMLTRQL